jgi:hypothetical protein
MCCDSAFLSGAFPNSNLDHGPRRRMRDGLLYSTRVSIAPSFTGETYDACLTVINAAI